MRRHDPTAIELGEASFIDPDLSQHYSDLLYRVRLRDGGEALVLAPGTWAVTAKMDATITVIALSRHLGSSRLIGRDDCA